MEGLGGKGSGEPLKPLMCLAKYIGETLPGSRTMGPDGAITPCMQVPMDEHADVIIIAMSPPPQALQPFRVI